MFLLTAASTSPVDDTIQNVVESSNYLIRWWNNIDWSAILSLVITKGISLIFIILFFYLLNRLLKGLLRKTFHRKGRTLIASKNRSGTIYKMTENALSYTMGFFFVSSLLSIIGVPVSTLLAGAGITGLAIGLGAQSFISDIVNGFFILLENQLDVGDSVKIGDVSGTVVTIGLRSTQIKGFDGTLHFLPNHMIEIISNNSRNDMRALIDLSFYPNSDFELVNAVLKKVNDKNVPEHPEIVTGPTLVGPATKENGLIAYQVIFYTLNGQQFQIQNLFLRKYLEAFQEAGIEIPTTPFLLKK